ncbi:hypothetical protein J4399_02530 [Candidatus Woesearchaeota archaeon]|nr:hypothetical protein [Candidatus Woesearchaeota archaeon]HIJ13330.1 hypothetical protein [Candidatus Woesearchaeota archaeon]
MNKKSQELMADLLAIIVLAITVVIMIALFWLTKDNSATNQTIDNFHGLDVSFMLDSFLRAPYYLDPEKNIQDIIVEDYNNNDYTRTEEMFNIFFKNINVTNKDPIDEFRLVISEPGSANKAFFCPINSGDLSKIKKTYISNTEIVDRDGSILKLTLSMEYFVLEKNKI